MPDEIREVPYPAGDVYLHCESCDISYRAEPGLEIPGTRCPACDKVLKPSSSHNEAGSDKTIIKLGKSDVAKKKAGRSLVGEVILDRYRVESEIGRGGMGIVYKAWHIEQKQPVAIKVLRAEQFEPDDLRRFLREGRMTAGLKHPNVVNILDIFSTGRTHYIIMEFIAGRTFDRWIEERHKEIQLEKIQRDGEIRSAQSKGTIVGRRKDPYCRRILEIVRACADALAYAHDKGVIHRDIKPQNILIDDLDQPKIVDFGLAKQVSTESLQTVSGTILGTPNYMAPEQAQGHISGIDVRSDTYALCAVLYYAFADRPPFIGETVYDILNSVVVEDPLPLDKWNTDVEKDLNTIVIRGLEKEKGRRFANMRELRDDVGRFLAGKPIHSRPPGVVYKGIKRIRKSRRLQISIAAAVVLIVATIVFLRMTVGMREQLDETGQAAVAKPILDEARGLVGEEALRQIDLALEAAPRYADAHIDKARVLLDLQRIDEALVCAETAVELNPHHPHAYYLKARILEVRAKDRGNVAEALTEIKGLYEKSLSLNPEQRFAILGKSRLLILQNNLEDALKEVESALQLASNLDEAYIIRGEIRFLRNNDREAEEDFSKALALNGGSVAALIDRGTIYLSRKEHTQAETDFTRAIAMNPDCFAALYNRGVTYRDTGRHDLWTADWKKLVERWPSHPLTPPIRAEIEKASASPVSVPTVRTSASTGDDEIKKIIRRRAYGEARQYCLDRLKGRDDDPLLHFVLWCLVMKDAKEDPDIGERKNKMRAAFERERKWRGARGFDAGGIFDDCFTNGDGIWLRIRKML